MRNFHIAKRPAENKTKSYITEFMRKKATIDRWSEKPSLKR